ncbi:hypothetical protein, partial [Haliscomenobacter sp.]|uniref:hypothetical protein n=1 Tax=Haliscomenobacter sp. TaxID=2717303 RepID=UPI003365234D
VRLPIQNPKSGSYFFCVTKCSAKVKKYSLFVFLDAVEKKIKKISPSSCEIPSDEFIFAVQNRKEQKIIRGNLNYGVQMARSSRG